MSTDPLLDRMTRKQVATELTALGYPVAVATLRTYGVRGGGPPYTVFGNRAMYVWGEALAWAQGRVRAPQVREARVA